MKKDYNVNDLVKVDLSSAGKGVQFLEIERIEKTDNINGYRNFYFKDYNYPVSEYYIRPIKKVDLKYRKIFEEKFNNFKIDDNLIKREFWFSQKEILKNVTDYLINFLYPYLHENKNVIELDDMNDFDKKYKKALTTKNDYWFVIPHSQLRIIAQHGTTWVTLFVILPNNKFIVYSYSVEYSDDDVVNNLLETTKFIIEEFEVQIEKNKKEKDTFFHYYNCPYISYQIIKKLSSFCLSIDNISDYYNREMPNETYTRTLFDISVIRHYLFTWND